MFTEPASALPGMLWRRRMQHFDPREIVRRDVDQLGVARRWAPVAVVLASGNPFIVTGT